MTDSDPDKQSGPPAENETRPRTRVELEESLNMVLQRAHENGVDFNDIGIDLRHDVPDIPDWEVRIIHLQKTPNDGK
ncbi:hypothetical protein HUG10_19690 (plasmid) [Halorarum halophilum]|uniref:Uncharacterized protein n=1 Tax=Halorarum halophilum TaxID=2743090 RepID=A0A7D5KI89_9EURY|nr:hypothetical protein [Halobaculum halophilum]QLG29836.1 hypothetical protein HUG10_19690 [Halobaculum halophilum]